jgi:hypothetical protein
MRLHTLSNVRPSHKILCLLLLFNIFEMAEIFRTHVENGCYALAAGQLLTKPARVSPPEAHVPVPLFPLQF